MDTILKIILFPSAAGFPIIIGGLISYFSRKKTNIEKSDIPRWITAFAGGSLFSAIAFALVPRALEDIRIPALSIIFLSGTFSFMILDIIIARSGSSAGMVLSMMMDFLPEALALGASFARDPKFGLLLAVFIGLQNLPEGFSSYPELAKMKKPKTVLRIMFALSFTGIFSALTGYALLRNHPVLIAGIMLYAAGGILYLIFQDVAPKTYKPNDWIPATGGSLGFLLGLIGEKIML